MEAQINFFVYLCMPKMSTKLKFPFFKLEFNNNIFIIFSDQFFAKMAKSRSAAAVVIPNIEAFIPNTVGNIIRFAVKKSMKLMPLITTISKIKWPI